jgi:hypothetical protein
MPGAQQILKELSFWQFQKFFFFKNAQHGPGEGHWEPS